MSLEIVFAEFDYNPFFGNHVLFYSYQFVSIWRCLVYIHLVDCLASSCDDTNFGHQFASVPRGTNSSGDSKIEKTTELSKKAKNILSIKAPALEMGCSSMNETTTSFLVTNSVPFWCNTDIYFQSFFKRHFWFFVAHFITFFILVDVPRDEMVWSRTRRHQLHGYWLLS